MSIPTPTNSSIVSPCLINSQPEYKEIATIVRWQHQRGGEAHCLVRLYVYSSSQKALAIVSELRSNPYGSEIGSDFHGLANTVIRLLGKQIEVSPENIIWIEHYGKFSYYDATEQEAFSRVDLKWNGQFFTSQSSDWHLLQQDRLQALLGEIDLISVPTVLSQLGWQQKLQK
jgi:hypothetical protein